MARTHVDGHPHRARRARTVLAALAALAAAAPAASARDVSTPIVSGLAWRSGAKVGDCLAAMRGRPLDVNHIFLSTKSFPDMVAMSGKNWFRTEARKAPLLLVSLPLLPNPNKGQFAQCAAGAFDASYRAIGANLQGLGAQGVSVRIGWEANIGSARHAWGVDRAEQIPDYRACWRRAATLLKEGGPSLLTDWTSSKKTQNRAFTAADMYPGDDVVDVIGVHQYDSGPQKSTQAVWDKYYDLPYNGGPWGLGTWLAFAQAHGKKLSVGEWAVWANAANKAPDDPVYVDNMYRFFQANAGSVAYESYQNSLDVHSLCPSVRFPNASAMYRASWSAAQ